MEKQSGLLSGTKGSLNGINEGQDCSEDYILSLLSLSSVPVLPDPPLLRTFSPLLISENSGFISSANQSSRQLASVGAAREAVWGGVKSSAVSFYCIHYSGLQKRRLVYLRVSSVEIFIKGERKLVGGAGRGWNLLLRLFHLSLVLFHTFGSRINCRI